MPLVSTQGFLISLVCTCLLRGAHAYNILPLSSILKCVVNIWDAVQGPASHPAPASRATAQASTWGRGVGRCGVGASGGGLGRGGGRWCAIGKWLQTESGSSTVGGFLRDRVCCKCLATQSHLVLYRQLWHYAFMIPIHNCPCSLSGCVSGRDRYFALSTVLRDREQHMRCVHLTRAPQPWQNTSGPGGVWQQGGAAALPTSLHAPSDEVGGFLSLLKKQ